MEQMHIRAKQSQPKNHLFLRPSKYKRKINVGFSNHRRARCNLSRAWQHAKMQPTHHTGMLQILVSDKFVSKIPQDMPKDPPKPPKTSSSHPKTHQKRPMKPQTISKTLSRRFDVSCPVQTCAHTHTHTHTHTHVSPAQSNHYWSVLNKFVQSNPDPIITAFFA